MMGAELVARENAAAMAVLNVRTVADTLMPYLANPARAAEALEHLTVGGATRMERIIAAGLATEIREQLDTQARRSWRF
jgi:Mg-chelatase subunit ChlD